jgi:hypothetical protein
MLPSWDGCLSHTKQFLIFEVAMRSYAIAILGFFMLMPPPAEACLGQILEHTVFFDKMPELKLDADVVAKVILEDVKDGLASARIIQVEVSAGNIHPGDKVQLKYSFSSCGPNHKNGEEGIIIAKSTLNDKGEIVLHPYERRYSDSRIEQPLM